ncbi:MAG: chemotaxis protein CheD [Methanomassiliicoccales archaeon]
MALEMGLAHEMMDTTEGVRRSVVGVAEHYVRVDGSTLSCIGLGSCIGIAIFDAKAGIGGLAHAMLPRYDEGLDRRNAFKYADTAVFLMVDELVEQGATKSNLRAKAAGGAQMFSFISNDSLNIGLKNAQATRESLKKEGIPLIGEDMGGIKGRTVFFRPDTGVYEVQMNGVRNLI